MKNILVPIDFSPMSERLMAVAEGLAGAYSARLILVHVAHPDPDFVGMEVGPQYMRDSWAELFKEQHKELQALAAGLNERKVKADALLVQGPTVRMILQEAHKFKADLIIMGSHGHGALYHLLVGSVCEGVLRKAPCPVLVVPADRPDEEQEAPEPLDAGTV